MKNSNSLDRLNLLQSDWPKGEETFSFTVWVSDINYPVVILMGAILIAMLLVWRRSKRNKQ
jgi:hypothetical protein